MAAALWPIIAECDGEKADGSISALKRRAIGGVVYRRRKKFEGMSNGMLIIHFSLSPAAVPRVLLKKIL